MYGHIKIFVVSAEWCVDYVLGGAAVVVPAWYVCGSSILVPTLRSGIIWNAAITDSLLLKAGIH